MTTINALGAQSAAATAAADNSISGKALGKEDFLRLLVAQLQNQDPLDPADPTQFTAQLAQFSSLEQMFNMNKSLQGLSSLSGDMERLSALGLIGREVVANSDIFEYQGQPVRIGYQLPVQATEISFHIVNANNQTVATLTDASPTPGEHFYLWDGTTNAGNPLPEGSYRLVVNARDADGKTIETDPLVRTRVDGVQTGDGQVRVDTGNGAFSMASLRSIEGAAP
ncbi:MAG: flagellar hook assembly protein FlgD [Deltaproteobacteria bacterium]|nr:MAG: flagellar hook assembly protein FlgD [Deltaproteobacteria bacterium]